MNRWSGFVRLLSATEDGRILAAFRVTVALVVLYTLAGIWAVDLLDVAFVDASEGGVRSVGTPPLFALIGSQTSQVVHTVFWVTTASALMMLLGLGGRIIAFITLQTFMALVDINGHAGGSYDELMTNGLWLCVLGNTTATWSFDGLFRTGSWSTGATVSVWPRLLAVYQLLLMYWTTGLQKVSSHWVPGGDFSALYFIFQQPTWQEYDMSWVAYPPWYTLTQIGTGVSWAWEVTTPVWLAAMLLSLRPGPHRPWVRATRWGYASVGVFFHLTVHAFMNIGPFSWASLAYYPCLVHGRELSPSRSD